MAIFDHFMLDDYGRQDFYRPGLDDTALSPKGRIAIVGLPNAGKKSVCNSLWGWDAVKDTGEMTRHFGLLTLIDLPLDSYDTVGVLYRLENTDLIVFVLDGERGLDPDSFNWIARLRGLDAAMLVVLNKADRIPADKLQHTLEYIETRTARPVIPLTGLDPQNVRDNLLTAILRICPDMAVPLATEFAGLRYTVAAHSVMQAAMISLTINLDINTRHDSSALVGLQLRLIRQIAAIYGYKESTGMRQRIGLSMVLRWLAHTAIKQSARIHQLEGRIGIGTISVASTFVVGRVAMLVYGGHLPSWLARYTPQAWRANNVQADSNGKL